MRYTFDGLVVKEMPWGENDKRIVVLSAQRGRVSVLVKGARSLKNKFANATGLFTYGNYEITERNGYAWLAGASVNESFWGLREDLERLALASYLVDVTGELTEEDAPAEEILRLTLNTLYAIAKDIKPRGQIKATHELRALALSGYMPDLSACELCGAEDGVPLYLDVMNGVLKCSSCLNKPLLAGLPEGDELRTSRILVPFSRATLSVTRYIMEAPLERVLSVTVGEEVVAELVRLGETYAVNQLEKRLPSLDFYATVMGDTKTHQVFYPPENKG